MFRKILYPTDFSDSANAALSYVKKLKEAGAEEVILLHVYDERKIDIYWEIEAERHEKETLARAKHEVVKRMLEKSYSKLKQLETDLQEVGLRTKLIVVEGIPYQEIVKVAEDMGASLIVMGSHGERGLIEKIIGSTTERVISHSPVPVLVIKPLNLQSKQVRKNIQ